MLKRTNGNGSESTDAQKSEKTDAAIISSSVIDSEEVPVTIAPRNEQVPRGRKESVSVFGSSLVFKGKLSADEEILIEGTVEGTIAHHKKNVTVGKQGRVTALIHANSITIRGQVSGDIHGDVFVILEDGCSVDGNIFSPRIRMEDGAVFNGCIQMT